MNNIYLQKLKLLNYRNFQDLEINTGNNPIILIGENGSGKTNILESISLFSPGKGLRSAKLDDICQRGVDHCSAYTLLHSKLGPIEISTNLKRQSNRRFTEFNGVKIQNNELSKFSAMIWLTPQMDGIFSSGISDRRKFFDRIVYNFNPSHAGIVTKYEYYMYERSKILLQDQVDTNWLRIIEEKMAELSVEIAINRLKILEHIQKTIDDLDNEFPKAILSINGVIEDKISKNYDIDIDFIKKGLVDHRIRDKMSNRTNFGVHKSDFVVIHKEKNALVKHCSTGEQKAMLIAIILAQVNYAIKENIAMPILLLDEVFVHLDSKRRQYLINLFLELGLQLWVTATDLNGIESLTKKAELVKLYS
ncbi:MAG: DNA replication/repair protein RecF [Rickettsia sp.]|nr:DNA replication/repair protein RecF [Rickettsia sp.]